MRPSSWGTRPFLRPIAGCLLLSCCVYNERTDTILELRGEPAAGSSLYEDQCMQCHGPDALGNEVGPDILAELHHGDARILTWILDGKADDMPAFPELSDQDAADLLAHLHALAGS